MEKIKKFFENTEIKFEFIAIVLIVIFSIAITPKTFQNDTYYSIAIGESVLQNGIDMKDHFSWHEDLAYTYPHWLFDVAIYLVYNIGNIINVDNLGCVYVFICVLSSILGISIYKANSKITKNKPLSFFLSIAVMYILKDFIAARAQLVSYIFFIWELYCIEKFVDTRKNKYAISLIAIAILIANIHVAVYPFIFVLFLPYIGEYFIDLFMNIFLQNKIKIADLKLEIKRLKKIQNPKDAEKLKEKIKINEEKLLELQQKAEEAKQKRLKLDEESYKIKVRGESGTKLLILVMILCGLAGLITPLGDTPYTYFYKTMQGNTTQNINEHQPLVLINNIPILCAVVIIIMILTFTKTKIRLRDLFLIGGLTFLMLTSKRHTALFALLGSIVLNKLVTAFIVENGKDEIKYLTKFMVTRIGAFLTILIISFLSINFYIDIYKDEYVDKNQYPVELSEFILKQSSEGKLNLKTMKTYNEYNYGSYLLYKGIPVFIDSRADLYAPEFSGKKDDIFMDFIDTSGLNIDFKTTQEKYGFTHVIAFKNSKVNKFMIEKGENEYKLLYEDNQFVFYEIVD